MDKRAAEPGCDSDREKYVFRKTEKITKKGKVKVLDLSPVEDKDKEKEKEKGKRSSSDKSRSPKLVGTPKQKKRVPTLPNSPFYVILPFLKHPTDKEPKEALSNREPRDSKDLSRDPYVSDTEEEAKRRYKETESCGEDPLTDRMDHTESGEAPLKSPEGAHPKKAHKRVISKDAGAGEEDSEGGERKAFYPPFLESGKDLLGTRKRNVIENLNGVWIGFARVTQKNEALGSRSQGFLDHRIKDKIKKSGSAPQLLTPSPKKIMEKLKKKKSESPLNALVATLGEFDDATKGIFSVVNQQKAFQDEFELGDRISQGGFGTVYKAKHRISGVVYIVKEIQYSLLDQQKNHLLLRELLVLKIVQGQKNLVNYFDGYLSVNTLHVVCEYCEMGSLSDLYEKRKCHLSEPEIALTCKSVLTALQYLHQHGVLHRDIKAANIFLTSLGEIKLGDFGTCAGITPAQRYRRTFVGTPFWMPPEIMLNSNSRLSDYDTSVDIWSLGITAIELAQCDPPLSDMAISHVIHWIPTHDPPTLKYPEKWSLQFIDFITGCLQKKSSDRPNCSELLLHSFLEFSREDAFLQPPPEPDPSQLSVAPPPENDDWTDWTMQGTIATGQFQTTGTWADWSVDMADNGDGPLSPEMVMDINNTARLLTGMPETMGNATKRAKVMQQQAVPGITELVAKHEREMYILQDNLLREFQKKKKELLKIVKLLAKQEEVNLQEKQSVFVNSVKLLGDFEVVRNSYKNLSEAYRRFVITFQDFQYKAIESFISLEYQHLILQVHALQLEQLHESHILQTEQLNDHYSKKEKTLLKLISKNKPLSSKTEELKLLIADERNPQQQALEDFQELERSQMKANHDMEEKAWSENKAQILDLVKNCHSLKLRNMNLILEIEEKKLYYLLAKAQAWKDDDDDALDQYYQEEMIHISALEKSLQEFKDTSHDGNNILKNYLNSTGNVTLNTFGWPIELKVSVDTN